jgi:hypothetical protein
MKPLIYIASPYTKGDPCVNTHFQMRMFDELLTDGVVLPYVPLWSHFQHTAFPRPYRDWIDYDLAIIRTMGFAGCLRLDATCPALPDYRVSESSGADGEVAEFARMGLPVFYDKGALYAWARGRPA